MGIMLRHLFVSFVGIVWKCGNRTSLPSLCTERVHNRLPSREVREPWVVEIAPGDHARGNAGGETLTVRRIMLLAMSFQSLAGEYV